jgi:hypothetical protein
VCHIGDAANLPLAPKQAVVIKFGDTVQVDGVDGNHAALSQAGQGRDYDIAAGSKRDGAIERYRRLFRLAPHPLGSQRGGQLAMRGTPRGDVDRAFPCVQDGDGQMRGGAEAEQSHALAGLHARHPKAAIADNARAQQRSGMQIVERGGQREYEIRTGERVFRVTSVDAVSGKGRRVAKVFQTVPAIPAASIHAAHPGDPHAGAHRQLRGGAARDFSHDLMARDERLTQRRQLSFDDVQVGAADAAGADPQQNFIAARLGPRHLTDAQRLMREVLRRDEQGGFHRWLAILIDSPPRDREAGEVRAGRFGSANRPDR